MLTIDIDRFAEAIQKATGQSSFKKKLPGRDTELNITTYAVAIELYKMGFGELKPAKKEAAEEIIKKLKREQHKEFVRKLIRALDE